MQKNVDQGAHDFQGDYQGAAADSIVVFDVLLLAGQIEFLAEARLEFLEDVRSSSWPSRHLFAWRDAALEAPFDVIERRAAALPDVRQQLMKIASCRVTVRHAACFEQCLQANLQRVMSDRDLRSDPRPVIKEVDT